MLNTIMENKNASCANILIPFLRSGDHVHSFKIPFIKILVKIVKIVHYL